MPAQLVLPVEHGSQVGEVRRAAVHVGKEAGFGAGDQGTLALVATELASNIHKHAGAGELLLQPVTEAGETCIELLAVDRGPGMADVQRCLRDGYSTARTPGNGLGAVRRLAREFDLWSNPGSGTVVLARLPAGTSAASSAPLSFGAVCIPVPGETICGDGWAVRTGDGELALMVADGLGHGPLAGAAVARAAEVFAGDDRFAPKPFLERAHGALAATRGAAIVAATVSVDQCKVTYAGVGNLSGTIWAPSGSQGLVSHYGTVGATLRGVQEFSYRWPADGVLVVHSDGLQSRWSADSYPGLMAHHPAVIAAVLYRDFRRGRDDATVVVVKARR